MCVCIYYLSSNPVNVITFQWRLPRSTSEHKHILVMVNFSCCFGKVASPTTGVDGAYDQGNDLAFSRELMRVENIRLYAYKDLRLATEDFSPANKIGEGGFGSVYKGMLKDGTLVAVKVLSAGSRQGLREFLTEITVISDTEHENLVDLYGCCVEGKHRILVYGFVVNNSLSQSLLGSDHSINFTWKIRSKICIGVAKGLAYLHEEVHPHIIHRDIKASNILLDNDFTPKISDFGMAKLFPCHLTHISTRIAGTLGYLAPEYAIRGQLTKKADIYSFGVLLLEIVTGSSCQNKRLPVGEQYLLERVWEQYKEGELEKLADTRMEDNVDIDEACRYLKIGLLCTQSLPKVRPSMPNIVKMLQNEIDINEKYIINPGLISELMGDTRKRNSSGSSSGVSGKTVDSGSYETSIVSHATMTFTSIADRPA